MGSTANPPPGQSSQQLVEPRLATRDVSPSAAIALGVNDQLAIQVWNSVANQTVQVNARILLLDGSVNLSQWTVIPNSTRTSGLGIFNLAPGFLLSISAFQTAGAITRGQTYCRCTLLRGFPAQTLISQVLCAGYLTGTELITFPPGGVEPSASGLGNIRRITGTTPAAGADISETVPGVVRWRLLGWDATLTTNATAGNRGVVLVLDDGATIFGRIAFPGAVPVSSTVALSSLPGATNSSLTNNVTITSLQQYVYLLAGYRIRTFTTNLAAGDQWTAPSYLVEEWIDA